ncbi:MAG TPA: hypothetical protein VEK33_04955 [Terriglobales bacterium]|nr:hypothetical protein [Terriglobales bacterium]
MSIAVKLIAVFIWGMVVGYALGVRAAMRRLRTALTASDEVGNSKIPPTA